MKKLLEPQKVEQPENMTRNGRSYGIWTWKNGRKRQRWPEAAKIAAIAEITTTTW